MVSEIVNALFIFVAIRLIWIVRKHTLLFIFFLCLTYIVKAQLISEYDEVIKRANAEIDSSMASGFLHKMALKYNVAPGEYTMMVSIHEKGSVISVFVTKSDATDVKQQNLVKDIVKQMDFSFKMPKGNIYKFEHAFKF